MLIAEYHSEQMSKAARAISRNPAKGRVDDIEQRLHRMEALARTIAYHSIPVESPVAEIEAVVALCIPKKGAKRVCQATLLPCPVMLCPEEGIKEGEGELTAAFIPQDVAFQMLCEVDLLARRRGDVVFLQGGTLLQAVRDGALRDDDDDLDVGYIDHHPRENFVHPLAGGWYGDLVRIGYYEGAGGLIINPDEKSVRKRFDGAELAQCLSNSSYLSKIEVWPYVAIDANNHEVYGAPPSLQGQGAVLIAVSYHQCMNYVIETVSEGLNYTAVSAVGSDLKWRLPILRQLTPTLHAPRCVPRIPPSLAHRY